MRRILYGAIAVLAGATFLFLTLGASSGSSGRTYKIELDNAYDLVKGGEFKVAGVNAGSIQSIGLDQKTLHAVVTVQITQGGFGQFHADAFCQSRPQSLIGEYFVDCQPGSSGPVLKSGATIPASHTQSTIPADLVQNIMQVPYRERFSLIINELGAAVAARSEDLQTALRRADPALAETDNLLNLLANDAQTIKNLNVSANTVITALAKNNQKVKNFITYANRASTDSATQASNIQASWEKLPGFLEQLRPALAKLGAASDAQVPVLNNLNDAANNLDTFFHELVPFSHESVPSLKSLGSASVVGRSAVSAATPTIKDLTQFTQHTPELAKNLAIVLHDLDNRGRAVEPDPRSPDGGKGYTGLEALLQYVYNITTAVNYFGPFGHLLGVDAFASKVCSPYATPQTLANNIQSDGLAAVRNCYAFLGPNQPGVTTPDPSWSAKNATPGSPSACVPDPGGFPEYPGYGVRYHGVKTNACTLKASSPATDHASATRVSDRTSKPTSSKPPGSTSTPTPQISTPAPARSITSKAGQAVSQVLGKLFSGVQGAVSGIHKTTGAAVGSVSSGTQTQAQQLLHYLLAP
jgi:phospholipid/cholesterol/gamma-HCH transport system substrate-binding protein